MGAKKGHVKLSFRCGNWRCSDYQVWSNSHTHPAPAWLVRGITAGYAFEPLYTVLFNFSLKLEKLQRYQMHDLDMRQQLNLRPT